MKFINVDNGDEEVEYLPLFSINDKLDTNFKDDFKDNADRNISILALKNTVLFPGTVLPIMINRQKSLKLVEDAHKTGSMIGVVSQKDNAVENPTPGDLESIGTVAKVLKIFKISDQGTSIIIQGRSRFKIDKITQDDPYLKANISVLEHKGNTKTTNFKALIESVRECAIKIIEKSPQISPQASLFLRNITDDIFLINLIAGNMSAENNIKQSLLAEDDIVLKAAKLLSLLQKEFQFVELKNKVSNKTKKELDKQQKDYFLQQQLKSIKDELGGENNDKEVEDMKQKSLTKKWSPKVQEAFDQNIAKLERMSSHMPDYSVVYNHLDLLLTLPWEEYTSNEYDINKARKSLDKNHYGLEKVKDRILEYLAVLKLKGDMKSPILCLYGPPGIGKTSLGKSIAEAINRKFIKISLGGLYDESEIRGHRKTYIGAMPGRIIQALRKSKTSNPVIVLDEIDKVGRDHRGDASSALLEVLDPEQNNAFYDHYLELEYDLSKILFITTANDLSTIQPPLRDRLEIIDLSGYAVEEKLQIAKKHLIPKQKSAHGLNKIPFSFTDEAILNIIQKYSRESGVRELDRHISAVMRNMALNYVAKKNVPKIIDKKNIEKVLGKERYSNDLYKQSHLPGLAVGLGWTPVGGDILFIETVLTTGKGELKLTGNLGAVMKESATTALTFLKANSKKYNIQDSILEGHHIHLHIPEGATPKEGPSAGITILTAFTSLLTNKKVKPYLAMTGEITLRGEVLPVGGIKEKILAAKRAGIKEIILCAENEKDILEIDSKFIKGIKFYYVKYMTEVLKIALDI